jgi:predicted Na+-dependent transporter
MPAPLILKVLEIIIFILMLGLGVNQSLADLSDLWRNPALMLRSLLAVAVLFPLATGLMLKLVPGVLPPEWRRGWPSWPPARGRQSHTSAPPWREVMRPT